MKSKTNFSSVKRVLKYIKKYRALLLLSILLSIVTVSFTLYIPIIIGDAIDLIIGENNVDFDRIFALLLRVCIISVIIALIQCFSPFNDINRL